MVAREGYPIETHTVVTDDCYILQMHRIPYGKKSPYVKGEEPRPAVYLQHGLLCSSADWVMGAPEKSLGINIIMMSSYFLNGPITDSSFLYFHLFLIAIDR